MRQYNMTRPRGKPAKKTAYSHPYSIRQVDQFGRRRGVKHAGQVLRFLTRAAAEAHLVQLRKWLPGGTVLEVVSHEVKEEACASD